MSKLFTIALLILIIHHAGAQNIAINTSGAAPHPSAMLDISSPDKGFLVPRLTSHTAITAPAVGLLVFNTTTNTFWFYNGTQWTEITFPVAEIRDADGDTWISVENTPDEDIIRFGAESPTSQMHFDGKTLHWTNNSIFIGDQSGSSVTGDYNTFLGYQTGQNLTTGSRNLLFGSEAGQSATMLYDQVLIGYQSGQSLTSPSNPNTFIGVQAGKSATTAHTNTLIGYHAGRIVSTSQGNTFIGNLAGSRLTTGNFNTYIGTEAGNRNDLGNENVAIGHGANSLINFSTSVQNNKNVFIGYSAGSMNSVNANVMIGHNAGKNNSGGWNNTFVGTSAGMGPGTGTATGKENAFFGWQSGKSCSLCEYNVFFGTKAGEQITSGVRNVFIGYGAGVQLTSSTSNTLVIANDEYNDDVLIYGRFAGYGATGRRVGINTTSPSHTLSVNGEAYKSTGTSAWVIPSDRRIKRDIEEFSEGLNVILQLDPIKYRYTEFSDASNPEIEYIGFIAQDVEQVAPYMVSQYDDSEGPSGLADKRVLDESALTKILVNAVQEQQEQIANLEERIEKLEKMLLQENAVVSKVKE